MQILGIDRIKCTKCRSCISECPTLRFGWDEDSKDVLFHKNSFCILCGHCIAICPEEAVLYKDTDGKPFVFEGIKDIGSIIPFENYYKLICSKRSIRQYKKEFVPKTMLKKVIDSMKHAPTGANIRTLKCTVLSGEEKVKQLSDAILNPLLESSEIPAIYKQGFNTRLKRGGDPIFHKAPHVIIIHNPILQPVNAAIAITYGMLAAETMGLGTCWIGFAQSVLNASKDIRKNTLGFNDYVCGVFTIGFPNVKYNRCPTRPEIKTTWLNDS